jgi:hypothetical protein
MTISPTNRTRKARITLAASAVLFAVCAIGCVGTDVPSSTSSSSSSASGGSPTGTTSSAIRINGKEADAAQIARIEQTYGVKVAGGEYWHDARSGLAGYVGYPAQAYAPGFDFGPVARNASNGTSGILFNGRELSQMEAEIVLGLFGLSPAMVSAYAGSYTLEQTGDLYDASAQYLGNLVQLANAANKSSGGGGGDNFWSSGGARGNSEGGCSYVTIPNSSSSSGSTSVTSGCG